MNQTFKKLMQKSFFRELTSEAKLIFSRKAKTQAIFNQLSRREFDGASFVDSTICLSLKPSFEEYPISIEISFCGGFGDVNYLEQKDFKYNSDFFFAV